MYFFYKRSDIDVTLIFILVNFFLFFFFNKVQRDHASSEKRSRIFYDLIALSRDMISFLPSQFDPTLV